MGKTVSVGVEELRDVWYVIFRFLEHLSMETTTGCWDDLRVVLTSCTWIPLEHGEAALVVHEVAAGVIEWELPIGPGLGEARHREHKWRRFGKGLVTCAIRIVDRVFLFPCGQY